MHQGIRLWRFGRRCAVNTAISRHVLWTDSLWLSVVCVFDGYLYSKRKRRLRREILWSLGAHASAASLSTPVGEALVCAAIGWRLGGDGPRCAGGGGLGILVRRGWTGADTGASAGCRRAGRQGGPQIQRTAAALSLRGCPYGRLRYHIYKESAGGYAPARRLCFRLSRPARPLPRSSAAPGMGVGGEDDVKVISV